MGFGFFKKVETADLIVYNGHVFTQDPNMPWASAVACRGDRIMGVGNYDDMGGLIDDHTHEIDLAGKYVLPGFIDVHRGHVLKIFREHYLDLSECSSTDDVLKLVSLWSEDNPEDEIIFGYGYREDLKPSGEMDCDDVFSPAAELLSTACSQRPVLLLCHNCVDCWTNTAAEKIIIDTAEEECVQAITVGYILNLLIPFNFEEIEEQVKAQIEDLSDKGFTSFLNLGSPDYFESLYQDAIMGLYNEGNMRQRFFGSFFVNRPLLPRIIVYKLMERRTNCLEMGGLVNSNMLNLYIDNENSPIPFSEDGLCRILNDVCDKGFEVFIEAIGHDDMILAYKAVEFVRSKGYKNAIVIASDYSISTDERMDMLYWESVSTTWGSNLFASSSVCTNVSTMSEVIDQLTVAAAGMLGMDDELGSIEKGKLADMAIFDENPFDCEVNLFPRLHTSMTVMNGEIVHDAELENDIEMYNLMQSQQL